MSQKVLYILLCVGIVSFSLFLRAHRFSKIPLGLNQDEVSAAYEAWSLLETGKDRWGNPYPVYFPSWGRGQNVLYSYICVPFYAVFGISDFSFRLPNVLLNIAALGIIFLLFYRDSLWKALIAVAVVGLSPWHVVLSRWALEENILPFWFALHFLFLKYALLTKRKRDLAFSFISLALASYTYALVILSLPLYFLGVVITLGKRHRDSLIIGLAAYVFLAFPISLYLLKPYLAIIPKELLWMSLPDMAKWPIYFNDTWKSTMHYNIEFIFRGFHDVTLGNTIITTFPHSSLVLSFAGFGISCWVWSSLKERNSWSLILIMALVASLQPFLFFKMNLNRSMFLQFLLAMACIEGIWILFEGVSYSVARKVALAFVAIVFIGNTLWFSIDYFRFYPQKSTKEFAAELEEVIQFLSSQNKPVYVTPELTFPYLYAAMYHPIHPEELQQVTREEVNGRFVVNKLKNYHFFYKHNKGEFYTLSRTSLNPKGLILIKKAEKTNFPKQKIVLEYPNWMIVELSQ